VVDKKSRARCADAARRRRQRGGEQIPGVRAGMATTLIPLTRREHDDINVLVLGSRVVGVMLAQDLVKAFLGANSPMRTPRAAPGKVKAIEAKYWAEKVAKA